MNILGTDNVNPSQRTNNITVSNNLFDDMTSATWGTGSKAVQLGDGPQYVTIDHNTIITTDTTILALYGGSASAPTQIPHAVYTNNMSAHNSYGIFGSNFASGLSSINAYMPDAVVRGNVLAGCSASKYPTGNFCPSVVVWKPGFVNYAAGDYHLKADSPYKNAGTDGKDLGPDIDALNIQSAKALSGDNSTPSGTGVIIITTDLPNGVFNQSYSQSVVCTGGAGGCVWQLRDSSLPAGIGFDAAAGLISGMPSQVQTGSISLDAYDPTWPANTASATLSLTIDPPPFVVTMPPAPAAQVGAAFVLTPTVSGAMGSTTWTVLTGTLPSGVALDAFSGTIAGTPFSWGSFTSLVQAQDSWSASRVDAKPVTITVAPAALSVDQPSLANAIYRTPYNASLSATGGTGSTTWSVTSGQLPEGIVLGPSGTLSGTPTALGALSVTVRAQDANWPDNVATGPLLLTVDPPVFAVAVPQSPPATEGQPYNVTATATGNVGTVTWTITSGPLPGGLTLNAASGAISGSPTTWGTYNVVVQGADSWGTGRVDAKSLTIVVAPKTLTITTTTLDVGTYRSPYQDTLTATGGTGAIVWSKVSGTLPNGVTLDAAGALVGTPTEVGAFTFVVRAADGNWEGDTDTKPLTLIVQAPIFTAVIAPAANGRVGLPLQIVLTASGQVGSVIWSVASGSLPPGVGLDGATGMISGVPTASGLFTAVIKAQDSWDTSRFVVGSLSIGVAPIPLAVTTAALPSGSVPHAYQATLAATGGTGLTTWTLRSGALPPGLILGANGAISGTPTAVGTFAFTVEAADAGWAGNVATGTLSITVSAREIVLYTADATRVAGTWSLVADASAAGGMRVWNPDAAAAKLTVALASPVNYVELTFQAEAGVAYHLWMRGKAVNNAWANDSVYVQFSGAVTAGGAAINRIGTTSAAALSIEDGTNAGLAGWGWADDSYGGFANSMYFAVSGPQTIRVQVREDGSSLDQIVLSGGRFIATAPGATKNDTTLLAK